ncbi:hypothetical protein FPV67DRAFT_1444483 [Lyophyllum atratum]|nr:hypothetical protein FPV67DRAFT_1444483 [Lyophyllum atratum]
MVLWDVRREAVNDGASRVSGELLFSTSGFVIGAFHSPVGASIVIVKELISAGQGPLFTMPDPADIVRRTGVLVRKSICTTPLRTGTRGLDRATGGKHHSRDTTRAPTHCTFSETPTRQPRSFAPSSMPLTNVSNLSRTSNCSYILTNTLRGFACRAGVVDQESIYFIGTHIEPLNREVAINFDNDCQGLPYSKPKFDIVNPTKSDDMAIGVAAERWYLVSSEPWNYLPRFAQRVEL